MCIAMVAQLSSLFNFQAKSLYKYNCFVGPDKHLISHDTKQTSGIIHIYLQPDCTYLYLDLLTILV